MNLVDLSESDVHFLDNFSDYLTTLGMALNDEQRRALRMSCEAQDYMLLLGMPGTGKTATLAAIVLAAAKSGKTILLCSHTRTAVDNVLSRLLDMHFTDFVRIGNRGSDCDPRIDPHHVDIPGRDKSMALAEYSERLEKPPVVATTCLGINHVLFAKRLKFDMVLVDEASQILQPICIGPLRFGVSMFVLVGDHYQLPPLMRAGDLRKHERQSREDVSSDKTLCNDDAGKGRLARRGEGLETSSSARDEGGGCLDNKSRSGARMDVHDDENPRASLFRRLCEAHPSAVVSLVKQYRMAAEIMDLSNVLVYGGNLSCGTPQVASRMLDVSLGGAHKLPRWIKFVVNPVRRLVFLDTDGLGVLAMDNECSAVAAVTANVLEGTAEMDSEVCSLAEIEGGFRRSLPSMPNAHRLAASRQNVAEAQVIASCICSLANRGLDTSDIAVLTPFRAQVAILRGALESSGRSRNIGRQRVEVCTIDQYQGKDKACVFVSFVRSNKANDVGPLLRDWRRINVAITRAKSKLVFVGSASTLAGGSHFLNLMVNMLSKKNAIVPVDVMCSDAAQFV
jgi:DNA replication ATP-dependent helicase Dna2